MSQISSEPGSGEGVGRRAGLWWLALTGLGCLALLRHAVKAPATMDYWWFIGGGRLFWEKGWSALGGPPHFVFTAPAGSRFVDS